MSAPTVPSDERPGPIPARLVIPAGSAGDGEVELSVTPRSAGWAYSSLRIVALAAGQSFAMHTGEEELAIISLAGSASVRSDDESFELRGRDSVFTGISDMVYVPRDADLAITSTTGGRFALPGARCEHRLAARYRPAHEVPVETRGAGCCSRQVNNFCAADSFEADRLIAVEVLTPAGNWSSYPPHKHDEARAGKESELEEIYYFEVAPGPAGPGVGYQRIYGTPARPIDLTAEVRDRDTVLVPYGWHGPAMAAPGYDLYYLNVMAGPSPDRAWLICDDPAHAWVRSTWEGQPVDPRLPMTSAATVTEGGAA